MVVSVDTGGPASRRRCGQLAHWRVLQTSLLRTTDQSQPEWLLCPPARDQQPPVPSSGGQESYWPLVYSSEQPLSRRQRWRRPDKQSILIADASQAFFEAKASRPICVELVDEDRSEKDRRLDRVGLLEKSMYGKRDAAVNWQNEVARAMTSLSLKRGQCNSYTHHYRERGIKALIHGDDCLQWKL